jgi:membrane protein implicated in regulation of membrane protease activity
MRHLIRYYTLEIYLGIYLLIAINVGSSIYGQNVKVLIGSAVSSALMTYVTAKFIYRRKSSNKGDEDQ